MTIHELCVALQSLEPEHEVFVALYVEDTAELFDIEGVRAHPGHAELEIYAAEEADDEVQGNGAVRGEPTGASPRVIVLMRLCTLSLVFSSRNRATTPWS